MQGCRAGRGFLGEVVVGTRNEVSRLHRFRHLEVLRRTPQRRHVRDRELDVNPVTEVSDHVEGISVARQLAQIHLKRLGLGLT